MDTQATLNRMETDIQNHDFLGKSYEVGDRKFEFTSFSEAMKWLNWLKEQANVSTGAAPRVRRIKCIATKDRKFG